MGKERKDTPNKKDDLVMIALGIKDDMLVLSFKKPTLYIALKKEGVNKLISDMKAKLEELK